MRQTNTRRLLCLLPFIPAASNREAKETNKSASISKSAGDGGRMKTPTKVDNRPPESTQKQEPPDTFDDAPEVVT